MNGHSWWRPVLSLCLVLTTSGSILSACTAPEVLPSVLGKPVVAQSPKHEQRRPTYELWEEPAMEYNLVAPEKTDWAEKLALLPKDKNGDFEWTKAFKDGTIKPKPGLEDKAEDKDTEDNVVDLVPADSPEDKAFFPHLEHTQILTCPNCHPAIFRKKGGAAPITMKNIKAGEYCGRCHGPVAFGAKSCERCHPE